MNTKFGRPRMLTDEQRLERGRATRKANYFKHRTERLVRQKERYRVKRDAILAYTKEWNQRPNVKARQIINRRRGRVAVLYGLTLEAYDALRGRPCEICGAVADTAIDHDHQTGRIRGTLCRQCNSGIGFLKDSPVVALAALRYLERTCQPS